MFHLLGTHVLKGATISWAGPIRYMYKEQRNDLSGLPVFNQICNISICKQSRVLQELLDLGLLCLQKC